VHIPSFIAKFHTLDSIFHKIPSLEIFNFSQNQSLDSKLEPAQTRMIYHNLKCKPTLILENKNFKKLEIRISTMKTEPAPSLNNF
jgi:hypothetical protein